MFKKAQSLGEKRKKMNGNVKQNKPKKKTFVLVMLQALAQRQRCTVTTFAIWNDQTKKNYLSIQHNGNNTLGQKSI